MTEPSSIWRHVCASTELGLRRAQQARQTERLKEDSYLASGICRLLVPIPVRSPWRSRRGCEWEEARCKSERASSTTVRIFAKRGSGEMRGCRCRCCPGNTHFCKVPLCLSWFLSTVSHSKMQILQAVNKSYYLLMLFLCLFSELVTSSTACV